MNAAVTHQQRLLLRARRYAYEQAAVKAAVSHVARVAHNHRLHGHGQDLAARLQAGHSAASDREPAGPPGWRTFAWRVYGFLDKVPA